MFLRPLVFALALVFTPTPVAHDPLIHAPVKRACPQWMIDAESVEMAQENAAIFQAGPNPAVGRQTFQIGEQVHAFCGRRPDAVLCVGHRGRGRLTLKAVKAIDAGLRAEFVYVSDQIQYGVDDYWENTAICGDCEDYALQASERLAVAGEDGADMSLMIWRPIPSAAHATLLVETADAGLVELGVGDEPPTPMDWELGVRVAFMKMDGRQAWTLLAAPFTSKTKR